MSYHGHFEHHKQPKKKRGLKIFLIILAVLLVIVAAAAAAGGIYYNRMMNKMNIIELPEDTYAYTEETEVTEATAAAAAATNAATTEATEPTTVVTEPPKATAEDIINILVVGQSSRAGEESRMADTTMVVSVNTIDGTVTVFSVLRDSYVKLPDYQGHVCGRAKFTVCYGLGYNWGGIAGAMEMTNICMRDNFGVEIDHNIEIDFESFIRVVDLLGGFRPVNGAHGFVQHWSVGHRRFILRCGCHLTGGKAAQHTAQQISTQHCQSVQQLTGGFIGADGCLGNVDHIAGIHFQRHILGGHAGFF